MTTLKLALDEVSEDFLRLLAETDNLQESTWYSCFAYRLHSEKGLAEKIHLFLDREMSHLLPKPGRMRQVLYSIPPQLKEILKDTAENCPYIRSNKGVTSPWLRAAIAYVATQERGWTIDRVRKVLAAQHS